MEVSSVERFLLACHEAKRIVAMLPELPQGIGARDVRILDTLADLEQASDEVRVGDVADRMGVSRPGITRDVARLADAGFVDKRPAAADKRAVIVVLTEAGREVQRVYARDYHRHLAEVLGRSGLSDAQLARAAETVGQVSRAIEADRREGVFEHDRRDG